MWWNGTHVTSITHHFSPFFQFTGGKGESSARLLGNLLAHLEYWNSRLRVPTAKLTEALTQGKNATRTGLRSAYKALVLHLQ